MNNIVQRRKWASAATWIALVVVGVVLLAGVTLASPSQAGVTLDEMTYLPFVARGFPRPESIFALELTLDTDNGGIPDAQELEPTWVRSNGVRWAWVEPEPGERKWGWLGNVDARLIALSNAGFRNVLVVRSTPDWAQAVPGHECGPIKPENLDEFALFLTDLVNRYKQPPYNVKAWELWNEPDVAPNLVPPGAAYGCWGDASDPYYGGGAYGQMLSYAYPAIKAADPGAQVVLGGLLLDCDPDDPPPGKDCTPSRFLEGILLGGGGDYFDIANIHAYAYYGLPGDPVYPRIYNWNWAYGESSTAIPEKTNFVRQTLQNYGYQKPVFNTEAALDCTIGTADCYEVQAMYAVRAYAEAISLGLKTQSWYALQSPWKDSGLIFAPGSPKPAYYAYQTTVEELAGATYLGPVASYPGLEGYAFHGGALQIQVVWSADDAVHTVTLLAGTVRVIDRYGTEIVPYNGTIDVDFAPVFIEVAP
jgi:hypothetical protein